jgi:hypothetical protein
MEVQNLALHNFNKKLFEFLQDLYDTFQMPEFKTYLHLAQMTLVVEPTVAQRMFDEHVRVKYEGRIMSKDEKFFMDESYNAELTSIDFVNRIKGMWKEINPDNKECIWKYMQVLVILSKQCTP